MILRDINVGWIVPGTSVSSGSRRLPISGIVADAGGQTLLIPKHPLPFPTWLCLTVAFSPNPRDLFHFSATFFKTAMLKLQ